MGHNGQADDLRARIEARKGAWAGHPARRSGYLSASRPRSSDKTSGAARIPELCCSRRFWQLHLARSQGPSSAHAFPSCSSLVVTCRRSLSQLEIRLHVDPRAFTSDRCCRCPVVLKQPGGQELRVGWQVRCGLVLDHHARNLVEHPRQNRSACVSALGFTPPSASNDDPVLRQSNH